MTTETVYLLHVERPFGHARHYLGSAVDLDGRLVEHSHDSGARLMWWVHTAGIGWRLARTWRGDRQRERRLRRQGGHIRLCPVCKPPRRPGAWRQE